MTPKNLCVDKPCTVAPKVVHNISYDYKTQVSDKERVYLVSGVFSKMVVYFIFRLCQ